MSLLTRWFSPAAVAGLVLLAGFAVTYYAWDETRTQESSRNVEEFHQISDSTGRELAWQLRAYSLALKGLHSIFVGSRPVSRQVFNEYVGSLEIAESYPGFQSLSFNRFLTKADHDTFERAVQSDTSVLSGGYPDFRIRPLGVRDDYIVVDYLEPFTENKETFGFDLAVGGGRREVIDRARDSGKAAASGPITLTVGGERQPAFMLHYPVYRNGSPHNTLEEKRNAFVGTVTGVFRMKELLDSALARAPYNRYPLVIYDVGSLDQETAPDLIFRDDEIGEYTKVDNYTQYIEVEGRRWKLDFERRLDLGYAGDDINSLLMLLWGGSLSILLSGIILATQARSRAQQQLGRLSEDLRLVTTVFENSSEGVVITDAENNIVSINKAYERITGYSHEELVGKNLPLLRSDWQDEAVKQNVANALKNVGRWQGEVWDRRKDGSVYAEWLTLSANRNEKGETTHYVGICMDVTRQKRAQDRISFLAHHDPLTGLPNRSLVDDRIAQGMLADDRQHRLMAVMFLDLDKFKPINDRHGHQAGDKLLQTLAKRFAACLRGADTVARLGGDEFVMVLPGMQDREYIERVARKLLLSATEPVSVQGLVLNVSASIGIALYPEDASTPEGLLQCADKAMYGAKKAGRNDFCFFSDLPESQKAPNRAANKARAKGRSLDQLSLEP